MAVLIFVFGAKYFDDEAFLSHRAMLEKNYTRRADAKLFA